MKVSALLSEGTGEGAKLPTSHTLHYWPLPLFSCLPSPVATATATTTTTTTTVYCINVIVLIPHSHIHMVKSE